MNKEFLKKLDELSWDGCDIYAEAAREIRLLGAEIDSLKRRNNSLSNENEILRHDNMLFVKAVAEIDSLKAKNGILSNDNETLLYNIKTLLTAL